MDMDGRNAVRHGLVVLDTRTQRRIVQLDSRIDGVDSVYDGCGDLLHSQRMGQIARHLDDRHDDRCGGRRRVRIGVGALHRALERDGEGETEPPELGTNRIQEDVLPIRLIPSPAESFREALLREKRAWIVETHRDGRQVVRRWEAGNMSAASNVIGNLRTRPRYRKGAWKQLGIESLTVSIQRP